MRRRQRCWLVLSFLVPKLPLPQIFLILYPASASSFSSAASASISLRQLCPTPSLSHTSFDTPLCHKPFFTHHLSHMSIYVTHHLSHTIFVIEGSLEAKLPTIWTVEKQSREEAERRDRSEEKRSEERRCRCAKR